MSDEIKTAFTVSPPFKRETKQTFAIQDGAAMALAAVDFSRPYETHEATYTLPAPQQSKRKGWYYERASMLWPEFRIEGNGDGCFYFLSRCEKTVYLFLDVKDMRLHQCRAGAQCDALRGHDRGRIRYQPPVKVPGDWED